MAVGAREIVSIVLLLVATVLNIVVLAIPDWLYATNNYGQRVKFGLFRFCVDSRCLNYQDVYRGAYSGGGTGTNTTAAGVVIGLLLNVIAVILLLVFLITKEKRQRCSMSASMGMSITAGIANLIAVGIWLTVFFGLRDVIDQGTMGPAFYLAIVVAICSFIHACLCPAIKRRGMQEVNPSLYHQQFGNTVVVVTPEQNNPSFESAQVSNPDGYNVTTQGIYPPGQNVYPPGQNVYPPGQHVYPAGQNVSPVGQNVYPPGQNVYPLGQNLSPVGQNVYPAGQNVSPVGQNVNPAGQNVYPAGQNVYPAGQGVYPRAYVQDPPATTGNSVEEKR